MGRKTDIKNKQSKQVSLMQGDNVPYEKRYVIDGSGQSYSVDSKFSESIKLSTKVRVEIENESSNNLGIPMPKGVVRTYLKDSQGNSQFVGEDKIDHTPEGEKISLNLGDAFDITAYKKQTNYKGNRVEKKTAIGSNVYRAIEVGYEVLIKNAKEEDEKTNKRPCRHACYMYIHRWG